MDSLGRFTINKFIGEIWDRMETNLERIRRKKRIPIKKSLFWKIFKDYIKKTSCVNSK
jgi:hypothetical protein